VITVVTDIKQVKGGDFSHFGKEMGMVFHSHQRNRRVSLTAIVALGYIRLRNVTSFYPRMVWSHALREAVADFAVIKQVL
jgi:hypothetical protein